MEQLRRAWQLLKINRGPLFLFETVYKMAGASLAVAGFSTCFRGVMRATGYRYLTAENLRSFAMHPLTLGFAFLTLLLIALYFLVDIGVVLCMLDQAAQGRRCGVLFALRQLPKSLRRPPRISLLLLLLFLPFLALFLHLGTMVKLISTIRIPIPLSGFFLKSPRNIALAVWILLIVSVWMLCWLCAPVFYLTGSDSFRQARRKSAALARRYWPQYLAGILLVQGGLMLVYGLAAMLGLLLLRVISASLARALLTSHVLTFLVTALLAVSILSVPVNYAAVYALLEKHTKAQGLDIPHNAEHEAPISPGARRLRRSLGLLALACAFAGCLLIVYRYQHRRYNLDIEYLHTMEVTAHRGDSAHSPENTMAAFQYALENGADWIELDVRQSSDGRIYCLHDSTLTRVTGVKKYSWELSWPELSQLDAGSHFSSEFAGEPLPLLEDVIDFAVRSDIRLNIELKPTVHDDHLEETVADIIRSKEFEDQCVVTCQQYSSIQKVKAYAPELTTVYVLSMAYGNLEQLTDADHFSINYSFISRDLVSRSHQMGKQVYAWTVNRADIMERMIDLGVDNIITNNVALGKACVSAAAASDIVQTLVEEWVEESE